MYGILNMNKTQQNFVTYLKSKNRASKNYVMATIAKAIADQLELPSGRLMDIGDEVNTDTTVRNYQNINNYYAMNHRIAVEKMVSYLNELVILDVVTLLQYVNTFYNSRYNLVYPNSTMCCLTSEHMPFVFFGLTNYNLALIGELQANWTEVVSVYNDTINFFKSTKV